MVKQINNIVFLQFVPLFFSLVLLTSCGKIVDPPEMENPGIPVYKVSVNDEDYGQFVSNGFSNLVISGKLKYGNETYKVKIKHQGYSSRSRFKKNYALIFETCDPVLQRKNVIMSGQAADPSFLRSYLAFEIFKNAGLKTPNIRPVVLIINGASQGLFYLIEPIDDEFFIKRGTKAGELYKAINSDAEFSFEHNKDVRNGFEKKIPEDENYYMLERLITTIDSEPNKTFSEKVEPLFTVDKFLQYMAVSVLICNWDGMVHNFYVYKDQTTERYEILPWDLDFSFIPEFSKINFPGSNDLIKKLLEIPKYRDQYKNYFRMYLDGCFSVMTVASKIDEMKNVISKAYSSDRWIQANGCDLNNEAELIKTFVKQRHVYIEEQLNKF